MIEGPLASARRSWQITGPTASSLFPMPDTYQLKIILGTRGSELALRQTEMVTAALRAAHPHLLIERKIIATAGDMRPDQRFADFAKGDDAVRDKGIFIKELEIALEKKEIDAAVHSLKDVPSELDARFIIAATLPRAAVEDVLITRDAHTLDSLPQGARVGTSSVRRARQLKWLRPDVEIVEIRGNVPTRVRKVMGEGALDAVLLAAAGLVRLDLLNADMSRINMDGQSLRAQLLDSEVFIPSAGQGAVGIEVRRGDRMATDIFSSISHEETMARVTAEREFLRLLGAGCDTPVGARTRVEGNALHMAVRVFPEHDVTAPPVNSSAQGRTGSPKALGFKLASMILNQA